MEVMAWNLIVVAHPDDESLYFASLLLARHTLPRPHRTRKWKVICVTDANADGHGRKRRAQFEKATKLLGADATEWWGFPDLFHKRLDVEALVACLRAQADVGAVFTHGILGEYGHPHHQDVSLAVHEAFQGRGAARSQPLVYSVAYNCYPDFVVELDRKAYAIKTKILAVIYGSETRRFAKLLPATASEGFVRVGLGEVRALHRLFVDHVLPSAAKLKVYRWFLPHLRDTKNDTVKRLF